MIQDETTRAIPIRSEDDVVAVRTALREMATAAGFSLVSTTKLVTAASELARNVLLHGGGGTCEARRIGDSGRMGIEAVFIDQGPGIRDLAQALSDGYTSGEGMGLGLGGAKRLSNAFEICSTPGEGTRVRIVRWK